jgi:hypothetical protein
MDDLKIGRRTLLAAAAAPWMLSAKDSQLRLRPQNTIVVTPSAPAREESAAAQLLQEFLRKITGTTRGFDIVSEDEHITSTHNTIAVGRTQWALTRVLKDLYRDGFVIRRTGSRIIIADGAPPGTLYGAGRFLEQFCGVRFYMPGELFTIVPRQRDIRVADADLVEEPFVKNCMMSGTSGLSGTGGVSGSGNRPDERDWLTRNAAFRKE